ncbi:hypothetical protein BDU57DRAFT_518400 [Ampelomyces quisqualis]|uniref:Uncharacterized protein n=1 Tax=Ampelomyces quisqualis TaxID=50730 RepID=A0A6A5QIZ6_AMPQU|nr:hypothetical protein BDU57DRAFT_518400 [Ampelomyces quisqualis]
MNTSFVVVGFGSVTIAGFLRPYAHVSPVDGKCRLGLRRYVTIFLLSFDVFINVLLTLVFLYLLAPVIRSNNLAITGLSVSRLTSCIGTCCQNPRDAGVKLNTGNRHVAKRVEKLLLRTLIGAVLVLPPTMGNLVQSAIYLERDPGFVCLMACTCDSMVPLSMDVDLSNLAVTWTVVVFHWLAISSEPDPRSSAV